LQGKKASVSEACEVLAQFTLKVGIDKVREMYGADWPRPPVQGEEWFIFREHGRLVGWSAVRQDPVEPYAWMILGVFPDYQKQGYSYWISRWTIYRAAKIFPDIQYVLFAVSFHNETYLSWQRKQIKEKKTQIQNFGFILVPPPGYAIFGIETNKLKGVLDGSGKTKLETNSGV
jgi:GNAT superfamily N-acetyltransferase